MDSTLACLAAWMPRQRWYAAKGRTPHLRYVASWDLPSDEPGVRVRTLLVADESTLPTALYQVPVVARATASLDEHTPHAIGSPEPGTTLIDGPHDAAYTRALWTLTTTGGTAQGPRTIARGRPLAKALPVTVEGTATVLIGEQSNTSIIFRPAGPGMPVICKVFRQVHPGLNPDIELQTALSTAGSPYIPRTVGAVDGEWPDHETAGGSIQGSFAFAQEFFPNVEDAWRVALRAAAHGEDFISRAQALGEATAAVHSALATAFGATPTGADERAETVAVWHRRLATAIAEVPLLAEHRDSIAAAYERAADAQWPALQRIHGDFHLGQVILVPGRGWVLLDFEGEPLRPMAERRLPDLALRDVAGMLRSFDYVAGSIRLDHPGRSSTSVREWARAAHGAFLTGYADASSIDLDAAAPLLSALEIDKAVYEAIYEARNRPTWITIPLRAIERLASAAS